MRERGRWASFCLRTRLFSIAFAKRLLASYTRRQYQLPVAVVPVAGRERKSLPSRTKVHCICRHGLAITEFVPPSR